VQGQPLGLDLSVVLTDRASESFEVRAVSDNGSVAAPVAAFAAADDGSATLDTAQFGPGRCVVSRR
jgi:hypothetical protein